MPVIIEFEFTMRGRTRVMTKATSTAYDSAKAVIQEIMAELAEDPGYEAEVGEFQVTLLGHKGAHVTTWRVVKEGE